MMFLRHLSATKHLHLPLPLLLCVPVVQYVVCLSLSEYFVYDFVAVIKLLKVCDIFMTL